MSDISIVQKLLPTNIEAEKRKWLFDPEYNPQFEYESEFDDDDLTFHGEASDEYLATARSILSKVLKNWPNDETYLAETEGGELTRSEVEQGIKSYLQRHNVESQVTIHYTNQAAARTSVKGTAIYIQQPVKYRSQGLMGMLEHEVGVHIFRRLNNEQQPWKGHRSQFDLHSYLATEEGLAVLHSHAARPDKHLWFPALSYVAVYLAQRLSFAQVAKELQAYVSEPERLWSICLKVKRGLKDTSMPGGFTKNQVYLKGTIEVLRWLKKNHYDARPLYVGKVATEDIQLALQNSALSLEELIVPQLILNREWYKAQMEQIAKDNKLPL
jgi:hypothetical protein